MQNNLKAFKARALRRPDVRREYDRLEEEFAFLDEILKARAETGLSQAQVAARNNPIRRGPSRIGTREPLSLYCHTATLCLSAWL